MNDLWKKYDKKVDHDALQKDIKEAQQNARAYAEVPPGTYDVKIHKMEQKLSKNENPMLAIQFKVLYGEYKGRIIFMNQVLTAGFTIHQAKAFLQSLKSSQEIEFRNYAQFADLILDVAEEIAGEHLEFELEYGQTDRGYKTFKITNIFEAA